MKNAVWYILLCIISTVLFSYTLWKKRDVKLVALYFFIAGLTYFLEYFVLVLFRGYVYYPKILENRYFDNIIGAIASNAFTIPMTSVFIAGFKLGFKRRLLIAVIVTLIEVLFVRIKIFEHYWWSYLYTFVGANIMYSYACRWYSKLQSRINHTTRFINLFFSNLSIQASVVFVVASILNLFSYKVHWFNNLHRGHIAFATLYIMFITLIFVSLVVFRLKWYWVFLGILLPSVTDSILLNMNILTMTPHWSLISFLIFRILILGTIFLFNKHLLMENWRLVK